MLLKNVLLGGLGLVNLSVYADSIGGGGPDDAIKELGLKAQIIADSELWKSSNGSNLIELQQKLSEKKKRIIPGGFPRQLTFSVKDNSIDCASVADKSIEVRESIEEFIQILEKINKNKDSQEFKEGLQKLIKLQDKIKVILNKELFKNIEVNAKVNNIQLTGFLSAFQQSLKFGHGMLDEMCSAWCSFLPNSEGDIGGVKISGYDISDYSFSLGLDIHDFNNNLKGRTIEQMEPTVYVPAFDLSYSFPSNPYSYCNKDLLFELNIGFEVVFTPKHMIGPDIGVGTVSFYASSDLENTVYE